MIKLKEPKKKKDGSSSSWAGVFKAKTKGKWIAQIHDGYKYIHLGTFDHELLAAASYEQAVRDIRNGNDLTIQKTKKKRLEGKIDYIKPIPEKFRVYDQQFSDGRYKRVVIGIFATREEAEEALIKNKKDEDKKEAARLRQRKSRKSKKESLAINREIEKTTHG